MDLQLTGKTVFISGSTAGIGFATAQLLLEEGATVTINGRSQEGVNHAINKLKKAIPAAVVNGVPADFSVKEDIQSLISNLPKIDILINNLGIYKTGSFFETTDDDWYHQFDVNVMSGVRLSRRYLPSMLQANWGRILFVSSECATLSPPDSVAYNMTKAGLLSISRSLAELTKGTSVTVNTVIPGSTLSEGAEQFLNDTAQKENKTKAQVENEFYSKVRTSSLIQRFAKVEEVASTITYLASPLSAATNGAAIKIDGGSTGGIL